MDTDDPTGDPTQAPAPAAANAAERYEIRVAGRLGPRWSAWFDGLTLTADADGTTTISGPVADQAALHGLLQRLRDLGVDLLSLTRTAPGGPVEHPVPLTNPTTTDTPGATR